MIDRRLPVTEQGWTSTTARRYLILEQRLDRLDTIRRRSQRFLNPPCCHDEEPPPTFFATYTLNLADEDRTLDSAVDPPQSDGVVLPTPLPAGAVVSSVPVGVTEPPTVGVDGMWVALCGITVGLVVVDLYTYDLSDPASIVPTSPITTVEPYTTLTTRFYPSGLASSTVRGLGVQATWTSTVDYGESPASDFEDTWPA